MMVSSLSSMLLLPLVLFLSMGAVVIHGEVIDFEQFATGEFVSDLGFGVTVQVTNFPGESPLCSNLPMIFDSSNPTGDDPDLGSPHKDFGGPGRGNGGKQGKAGENSLTLDKVLIISEDCNQTNPDDDIVGGIMTFTFNEPKPLRSIGLLDFEKGVDLTVTMEDGSVAQYSVSGLGNNGYQEFKMQLEDVVLLVIEANGSGAVAFLDLKCKIDPVGAYGDPHYKTWASEIYSFHGICDLVMVKDPSFDDGLGLNIHLRTIQFEKNPELTVIERAVVEIGGNRLEVASGQEQSGIVTWSNGVPNAGIPTMLSMFPIHYRNKPFEGGMLHVFTIDLGKCDAIVIKSFPHLVDVRMRSCPKLKAERFGGSLGLLGNIDGELVVRNGAILDDFELFASKWQVTPFDPKLFRTLEGPQFPQRCAFPGDEPPPTNPFPINFPGLRPGRSGGV